MAIQGQQLEQRNKSANIGLNEKNLQIIYKSTASDTSNIAKKSQKLICVGGYNITFCDFCSFRRVTRR